MDIVRLENLLMEIFDARDIHAHEPMSAHTTFKIGGPADFFVEPHSADQIQAAIQAAHKCDVPWCIVGCGSDLLVADAGLTGLVIHIGTNMAQISIEGTTLHAQAGATNADVAEAACNAGLSGYEFASGIPGSIGGAAIMNAGAYDGEFRDVARCLTCLTPDGDIVSIRHDEADWRYRHSMMSDRGYIVLDVELSLTSDSSEAIRARIDDLAQRRAAKQPLEMPSAGSTFKRPTGYFAGKLIQDTGMRGHRVGDAMVSCKHSGFVVNAGHASAEDVRAVIRDVQDAVYAHDGVHLECEVRMWGFDNDEQRNKA